MKSLDPFFEIEREMDLFSIKIRGCDLWSYCRAYVSLALDGNNKTNARRPLPQQITKRVKNGPLSAIRLLYNLKDKLIDTIYASFQFFKLRKAKICLISSPRKKWEGHLYWCMYTDDLATSLSSCTVLDFPFGPRLLHPVPNQRKHLFLHAYYLPAEIAVRFISRFQRRKYLKYEEEIKEALAPAFSKLEQAYAQSFDWSWCVNEMTRWVLAYPILYRLYHTLLRKIEPKAVVTTAHHALYYRLIIEVAKDLGIPTIELQHAIIDHMNISYNYAPGSDIKQFADYMFVFSDFWKCSALFPIDPTNVIAVGYPYCERRVMDARTNRQMKSHSIQTVLFLSQLGFSQHMAQVAADLEKSLNGTDIRIIYKLHPKEFGKWRDLYPQLVDTKIEVLEGWNVDVYDCFSQAYVQIGTCSTAIYEGLAFGLETYVLRTDEFDSNIGSIKDLCKNGYATAFSTAEELIALLQNETDFDKRAAKTFWKTDALSNMHAAIEQIISQHQAS